MGKVQVPEIGLQEAQHLARPPRHLVHPRPKFEGPLSLGLRAKSLGLTMENQLAW